MPKKKPEKSLDELLEEALVKEDEQPYEVPGNWVWVRICDNFELCNKKIVPQNGKALPYIGLEHMVKGGGILSISTTEGVKSAKSVFRRNDVLYGKLRPYLDKHTLAESDGVCSTDILVFRNKKHYIPVLLNLYLGLPHVVRSSVESSSGINLPRVSGKVVSNFPMPLPPLPEQKRIVKKLSSMLGKLKEAKELIQEAKETFEERRAAILNKAFTGELTKKWRGENPDVESAEKLIEIRGEKKTPIRKNRTKGNMPHTDISYLPPLPTKWEWAMVGEISDKIHYGYTAKSEGEPIGPKLLRITDIQKDTVDWNIVPYCKIDENQKTKYFLREGDLVFARTGATVGKSYLLSGKFPESVFASYLIRIIINERVSNRYISNFFKSPSYWRQIASGQVGIGQPNVNAKTLSKIILPLPAFSEQKEIVRILEKLLDHEDEARALIDMEEQIDLLEKSILSKAFRGELGTNDTNDEPAIELLKRSLKEKATPAEKQDK